MYKRLLIVTFAIIGLCALLTILPIHSEEKIYDSVLRLHVLANSDSEEDQALKLKVRDAVLAETEVLLADVKTRDAAEDVLAASLPLIIAAAQKTVQENGASQEVTATLGEEQYPTREYEELAFPAGEYLSLRVMLGEAEGENWWCVLFPPLCLSAATAKGEAEEAFLSAGLTDDQYRIITDSKNGKYRLRFKLLEVARALFD